MRSCEYQRLSENASDILSILDARTDEGDSAWDEPSGGRRRNVCAGSGSVQISLIYTEFQREHTLVMRTTIKLDDEAGEIVRLYADSREISISKAISELVLEATQPKMRLKYIDGTPVFDVPRGDMISDELVRQLEAELI